VDDTDDYPLEIDKEKRLKKMEKISSYSKLVKECYMPRVSEEKR